MKRRDGLAFSLGGAGNGLQIHRVKITERVGAMSLLDAVSLKVGQESARNLGLLFGLQIGEIPWIWRHQLDCAPLLTSTFVIKRH